MAPWPAATSGVGWGEDAGHWGGQSAPTGAGEWVVQTEPLSTYRSGTETAKTVCAVSDGAEWIQCFVDLRRPDAVRILDFALP
jgi:hypothetical protein